MSTGYTAVSASHLKDSTGTAIGTAVASFSPVDSRGTPISFRDGADSPGQVSLKAVETPVSNGSFEISLADTSLTTPINIGYKVVITDSYSSEILYQRGYECIQPFGASWDFDEYTPGSTPFATGAVGGDEGGEGGDSSPTLIFASPDSTLYRLAIVSGALAGVPYSGSSAASPLYLLDQGDRTTIWSIGMQNGGGVNWVATTGVTPLDSIAILDDVGGASHTLTMSGGAPQWT